MSEHVAWDASEYDVVADVQERWGRHVVERRAWRGDEVALDAGCGSGRLFPALLEKLPRGRIYGVDADARMVEQARARAARLQPAVPVVVCQCDLTRLTPDELAAAEMTNGDAKANTRAAFSGNQKPETKTPPTIDVIISNAVFHWIHNKLALFGHLMGVLKPGGRLVAQFGGEKNLQRARAAAYRAARDVGILEAQQQAASRVVYMAAAETREQLKVCGFRNVRVWEHPEPTTFPDRESFLRFCSAVIFTPLRPLVNEVQWQRFLDEFAAQSYAMFGEWQLDYVRQNIDADK